jgi:hypothetical protein
MMRGRGRSSRGLAKNQLTRSQRNLPSASSVLRDDNANAAGHSFGNPELFDCLSDIVSRFSTRQRQLIRDAGFSTFIDLHIHVRFDKNFSIWLMGKVDTVLHTVDFGGRKINFFSEDICKIIGLPNNGKQVWDACLDKSNAMRESIAKKLGIKDDDEPPSVAAERVIRTSGSVMCEDDEDGFITAFVVYVISIMVDTKTPSDDEIDNYWPALKDSKKINSFDWSGLLLSECMTMCNCAKIDAKKRMTPTPPAGCLLIMTVNSKCHQSIKFSLALINVYCFFFPFYFFC